MGFARKKQILNNVSIPSPFIATGARNLSKGHLGGFIFGCKNSTIQECLIKQLFGLPAQHFLYVKNIAPGLLLFLFNYNDRNLHGIFEAACIGQLNIDPYGWMTDGTERTLYPAQVQVRVRLYCQPLLENQFASVIHENYYTQSHFWFELDHAQANKLIALFSSQVVALAASFLENMSKWRIKTRCLPSSQRKEEDGNSEELRVFRKDQIQKMGQLEQNLRFAFAAVELNKVLYVAGGFDRKDYLRLVAQTRDQEFERDQEF